MARDRPYRHAQGFDGLVVLVQEVLKRDPHNGHLFVFRGRRGGLIKVLWHDGQGLCPYAKRLERGRFIWPSAVARDSADMAVTITPAQLGYLLEGIDWRLPQHTVVPTAGGTILAGLAIFGENIVSNPTPTPTPAGVATATPTPSRVAVVVPTLSFPMLALLGLALVGAAVFAITRR